MLNIFRSIHHFATFLHIEVLMSSPPEQKLVIGVDHGANDVRVIMSRFNFCILTFLCFTVGFIGCRKAKQTPPVPVPEVVVATVQVRDVQQYIETDGFAEAFEFVEIPARVTGFLRQRRYTPGDIVKAGAPLFLIEQTLYLANVESAQAALESAKAQLMLDEANLLRTRKLIEQGAKTEEDLQTDQAKRDESAAAVRKADADLATAQLNLSYTDVRSPITGKVDRNLVDVGNLVGPDGDHEKLTTVAGMDPIYIYFEISDYQFNGLRDFVRKQENSKITQLAEQLRSIKRKNRAPDSVSDGVDDVAGNDRNVDDEAKPTGLSGRVKEFDIPFEAALIKGGEANKRKYPFQGLVDMTSNVINRTTGTITVRGEVPNSQYTIFPGQICYVRIPTTVAKNALLVEERAILTDLNNRYVFVVNEKNQAERRNVTLGKLQPDGTRIIVDGLKKEERYILVGGQKVRNHGQVEPVEPKKVEVPEKDGKEDAGVSAE